MRLSQFNYELPKELIAQYPAKGRDDSRMMVLNRKRWTIEHRRFKEIASFVDKKDTVVFNNSRVVPARLLCKRETGGKAEIFLLKRVKGNLYEALVRPASRLFTGKKVICEDGKTVAEIVENREVGKLVRFANVVNIEKELKRMGHTPLPPYIKRPSDESDKERYQTIYAKNDGSTAAPTAGLHFTDEILRSIKKKDAGLAYVTLHVSYGTFAPIKTDDVSEHRMHKESFELPKETQEIISKTKEGGGRIMAVGTTTTRVLEDKADLLLNEKAKRKDSKGSTGLFIYPGYDFKVVDALLTNFHLPKSTLLMLVSAFAGKNFIFKAYKEAIRERYRFYSYGDCMLIL